MRRTPRVGLSQRETAQLFRVSTETIARWETDAGAGDGQTSRPLVAPLPPVSRFADVVRATVKTMELAGFGGNDLIARALARTGWRLSARMGGRIRRERWPFPPPPSVPRFRAAPARPPTESRVGGARSVESSSPEAIEVCARPTPLTLDQSLGPGQRLPAIPIAPLQHTENRRTSRCTGDPPGPETRRPTTRPSASSRPR